MLSARWGMSTNDPTINTDTLEDMRAIREAELEYCYDMGISIEDANEEVLP